MAPSTKKPAAPVTFDLPLDLLAKIENCRRDLGLDTASAVIRAALERFDFAACQPPVTPHRQISVRLTADQRSTLKRFAKIKEVSVGELLRLAIEDLPAAKAKAPKRAARKRM